MMRQRRILVLHSGGMDSTVCLYAAHEAGHEVVSLGIDYGQRLAIEMMFAERHCAHLGIRREVVQVHWNKPERDIPLNRAINAMPASVSPAFLPSRNIVFLAVASAHAAGLAADEVQIGLNSVDYSGYPDCTVEFFEAFKAMLAVGNPKGPSLTAPLLRTSKREIAARAQSLGLSECDTWSCYRPQFRDGRVEPCHQCDACRLHAYAWAKET
jgi:7-cyano-7-deazaguanine synthase